MPNKEELIQELEDIEIRKLEIEEELDIISEEEELLTNRTEISGL